MKLALAALLTAALGSSVALAAPADNPTWAARHPRRAEVRERLARERERIDDGVRAGQLSPREARHLRRELRAIRAHERVEAAEHGGHLTRGEQRRLNRQEDRLSREIYVERHD